MAAASTKPHAPYKRSNARHNTKIPRFVEFTNSRFYPVDLEMVCIRELKIYSSLGTFADHFKHVHKNKWYNVLDNKEATTKDVLRELNKVLPMYYRSIFIDLYVDEPFAEYRDIRVPRMFRYWLEYHLPGHITRQDVGSLYPISDMTHFNSR